MCLHLYPICFGNVKWNEPIIEGDIRYKVIRLTNNWGKHGNARTVLPSTRFRSPYQANQFWRRNQWMTSSRRNGNPLSHLPPAPTWTSRAIIHGFHFFINIADATRELNVYHGRRGRIGIFKVSNFIASGRHNGDRQGEAWHRAKLIGYITPHGKKVYFK